MLYMRYCTSKNWFRIFPSLNYRGCISKLCPIPLGTIIFHPASSLVLEGIKYERSR